MPLLLLMLLFGGASAVKKKKSMKTRLVNMDPVPATGWLPKRAKTLTQDVWAPVGANNPIGSLPLEFPEDPIFWPSGWIPSTPPLVVADHQGRRVASPLLMSQRGDMCTASSSASRADDAGNDADRNSVQDGASQNYIQDDSAQRATHDEVRQLFVRKFNFGGERQP